MSSTPEHAPDGDPCVRPGCGLAAPLHRRRARAYVPRPHAPIPREQARANQRRFWTTHKRPLARDTIIGIDGEGQGRRPHLYTYLAASAAEGDEYSESIENPAGLSTQHCLDFLVRLPARTLVVGFSFKYDLTKILKDLDDESIYKLFHEKTRQTIVENRVVYKPVEWSGFRLNYMNRRFTVESDVPSTRSKRGYVTKRTTVWDIFSFFQCKFTKALIDWQIADEAKLEHMARMKERRAEFDKLDPAEVQAYCQEECRYLAKLCRALIDAHESAGLKLTSYYGAGSTATAILKQMDVRSHRGDIPEAMRDPIARGFFGGRFENSCVGPIVGPVFNYDLSSAYPYEATFLPCLKHGAWRRVQGRGLDAAIDRASLALVHWRGDGSLFEGSDRAWGPWPMRADNGTIMFPLSGLGGWVWKKEYQAGLPLGQAHATEAWCYDVDCNCAPFARVPLYYIERCRWGKDARGIPLKLGPNSIYGKMAQSKGLNPPFQSWIWAGNITSGTRAELLRAISAHRDPWSCLMLATDGVWTRERLALPAPRDTGTADCEVKGQRKPLGGWEEKKFERGVFAVRPGIYFPLEPTEDELEKVRARGLGRRVLYEKWRTVVAAHAGGQVHNGCDSAVCKERTPHVEIGGMSRFVGATSAVTRHDDKSPIKRSKDYGEWVDHAVKVSFNPFPKRRAVGSGGRLLPWSYIDWESDAYEPATKDPEAEAMALAELIATEQPDLELGDLD